MNSAPPQSRPLGAALSVLILGAVGFSAGFFGPMVFVPEANQGPLLGIFITGPLGALLGLVLHLVCGGTHASNARRWQVLWSTAAAMTLVTLYFCQPQPALRGSIVEVQIERCGSPMEKVDAAIEQWNKRIAQVTWAAPRAGWQADAIQTSRLDRGAVLDVLVLRRAKIYEHRKPWDKGKISAGDWNLVNERKAFYVAYPEGSCGDYGVGSKAVRFTPYDTSALSSGPQPWPPKNLSDFLDLEVFHPVPDAYQRFIR